MNSKIFNKKDVVIFLLLFFVSFRIAFAGDLKFNTNGGNVGIGTSTPSETLEIQNANTSGTTQTRLRITDTDSGENPELQFQYDTSNHWAIYTDKSNNNALTVWRATNLFTILGSGNVGIGTMTPATKLDVSGTVRITGSLGLGTTTPSAKIDVVSGGIKTDSSVTSPLLFNQDSLTVQSGTNNINLTPATGMYVDVTQGTLRAPTILQNTKQVLDTLTSGNGAISISGATNSRTITFKTCAANETLVYDGTNWICSASGFIAKAGYGDGGVGIPSGGTIIFNSTYGISYGRTGNTITFSPVYGSTANTIAQGNTAINVNTTGNLTGGSNGTAGGGLNVTLNTVMNPTFTNSVTTPVTYGSSVASGNLLLDSTSNSTKGNVIIAPNGGNVGIGTTNPQGKLDVSGNINIPNNNFLVSKTTGGIYYNVIGIDNSNNGSLDAYNNWIFKLQGSEKMRINSSGNVGIGTTSPSYKLDVNGIARATTVIGSTAVSTPLITNGENISITPGTGTNTVDVTQGTFTAPTIKQSGLQVLDTLTSSSSAITVSGSNNSRTLGFKTCAANETLIWNGTDWACVASGFIAKAGYGDGGAGIPFGGTLILNAINGISYGRTNNTITFGLTNTGVTAGTYPKVTVGSDGRVTYGFPQIDLTKDVSNVLPIAYGGTNNNSFGYGQVAYYNGNALAGNSGLYYDGVNNMLGVGTTNPTSPLTVVDSLANSTTTLTVDKHNASSTGNIADFRLNGNNKAAIGYNGVLYSSGAANINGSDNSYVSTSSSGTIISRNIADANTALIVNQQNTSSTGHILDLRTAGSNKMVVTYAGNVGIGTTNPSRILEVKRSGQSEIALFDDGTYGILFQTESSGGAIIGYNGSAYNNLDLRATSGAGTGIYLPSTGNVGIGTTNPSYSLDVNGIARANSVIGTNSVTTPLVLSNSGNISLTPSNSTYGVNVTQGYFNSPIVYQNGTQVIDTLTSSNSAITVSGANNSRTLAFKTCAANETLEYNGTDWVCVTSGFILKSNSADGGAGIGPGDSAIITSNSGITYGRTGNTITFSPVYGSTANTIAQGNTAINVNTTGNLTGGSNGTAGGGLNVTLNTVMNPTFTNSVTTPVTYGSSVASGDLVLDSTSNATKGDVVINPVGGNVGIGNTAPVAKLDIKSSAVSTYPFRILSENNKFLGGLYETSSGSGELYVGDASGITNVVLRASGSSYLNGGSLGIGITNPQAKLDVSDTANVYIRATNTNSSYGSYTQLGAISSNNRKEAQLHFADRFTLYDYDNSASRLVVDSSGNVGIGTTSPSYKLDVNGIARATTVIGSTAVSTPLITNGENISITPGTGTNTVDVTQGTFTAPTIKQSGLQVLDTLTSSSSAITVSGSNNSRTLGFKTCATNETLQWDGTDWVCIASGFTAKAGANDGGAGIPFGGTLILDANNGITYGRNSNTITFSPVYGSTANTIAQGNTAINVNTTGNLTGGGTGTAGGGLNRTLNTVMNPTFTNSVTTPVTYGSSVASGDLVLDSTSNATKGDVVINPVGGNVGIRTTTPGALLDIGGTSGISGDLIRMSSSSGNYSAIGNYASNEMYIQPYTYFNVLRGYSYTSSNRKMNSADVALKITSNAIGLALDTGNVGVGTISPSAKLDVMGGVKATNVVTPTVSNTTEISILPGTGYGVGVGKTPVYGRGLDVNGTIFQNGYQVIDNVIAGGGISVSGSANTRTVSLSNSGVTAGTYPKVNVDTYGRVTYGYGTIDLAKDATGVLPIAYGGTNTSSFTSGQVTYYNGTQLTGSNNLYWDSSNSKLGIGTSTPWASLTVAATTYPLQLYETDGTVDKRKYYLGFDSDKINLNGQNDANSYTNLIMTWTHDGNVGIGTTSPAEKLQVAGNIAIAGGGYIYANGGNGISIADKADEVNVLKLRGSTTYYSRLDMYGVGDSSVVNRINTSGTSYINGGSVGIGTTSPSTKLDVVGGGIRTDSSVTTPLVFSNSGNLSLTPTTSSYGVVVTQGYLSSPTIYQNGLQVLDTLTSSSSAITVSGSNNSRTLAFKTCATNETLQWDGTDWVCIASGFTAKAGANDGGAGIPFGGTLILDANNGITYGRNSNTITFSPVYGSTANTIAQGNTAINVNTTGNLTGGGTGTAGGGLNKTLNTVMNPTFTTSVTTPVTYGSSVASGTLTLKGTSNATYGNVLINPNGGNVAIGNSSPTEKLDVSGNIKSSGIVSGNSFVASTSTISPLIYGGQSAYGNLTIDSTLSSTKGNIILAPTDGNVGIGTTTPSAKLEVNGGIKVANNSWISAVDSTGSGVVNMFKVNSNNEIEVGGTLNVGTLSLAEDSGAVTLVNMPVSATPSAGTEESYSFSIDSNVIAKVYSEADGLGGIQNPSLVVNGTIKGATWAGNTVDISYGGTGLSSLCSSGQVLKSNGTSYYCANDIGDGNGQWLVNNNDIYYNLGNVGIGTSNPAYKLDVTGGSVKISSDDLTGALVINRVSNSDQKLYIRGGDGGGNARIASQYALDLMSGYGGSTNYDMTFTTAYGRAMIIDATNNNIGISKSPVNRLDVSGNISASGYVSGTTLSGSVAVTAPIIYQNGVQVIDTTSAGGGISISGSTNSRTISLSNSGVTAGTYPKVTVDTYGRVTSGTTLSASDIPSLDTSKLTSGTLPIARGGVGLSTVCPTGQILKSDGTNYYCTNDSDGQWLNNGTSIYYNTGNVGIGTSSPSATLHLQPTNISGIQEVLRLQDSGAGSDEGGYIRWDSGGKTDQVRIGQRSNTNGYGSHFVVYTNSSDTGTPSERLRVDSNGNVGINDTSVTNRLEVGGNISASGYVSGTTLSGSVAVTAPIIYQNGVQVIDTTSAGGGISISGSTNSRTISLSNSGVTAGTYPKVTVDTYGRVTSGTTLSASDIPSLDTSKLTSGTLPIARGGTNASSYTSNQFLWYNGTSLVASGYGINSFLNSASGTTNYLSKFTSNNTIGNSTIYDNGTNVGIGTTSLDSYTKLSVNGWVKSRTGYLDKNLLDTTVWSTNIGSGTGSVGSFTQNGSATENGRIWDVDPFNRPAIIWESINDSSSDADGGWIFGSIPVDNNKAYRLSVWIKRLYTSSGNIYLGCDGSNTLNLDGSTNTNPYFFSVSAGNLEAGKWYLFVGYIHANNDSSTTSYSAIYDGETGKKVLSGTDYKNRGVSDHQIFRTYNYYDTTSGDIQYFWSPRFEEINGSEPTIESILGIPQGATNGSTSYFAGSVGIGTTSPSAKIDVVGGGIRTDSSVTTPLVFSNSGNLSLTPTTSSYGVVVTQGYLTAPIIYQNGVQVIDTTSAGGGISISGSTNSRTISLSNSGVTAGTYPKVTVDTYGRVTSGTTLSASDIPSLDTSKLTSGTLPIARGGTNTTATPTAGSVVYGTGSAQAYTSAGSSGQILKSNGSSAPTWTTLDMSYLPDAVFKKSVKAATTANITLSGAQTIDGVSVVAGDRVLVKDQTASYGNGIYTVSSSTWTRVADGDTSSEIAGAVVNIDQGTANGGLLYSNDFKTTDTLGTTNMPWYALVNTGRTQTLVNKTMSTGSTWNGNTVAVNYGGTGATSFTSGRLIFGNGTSALNTSSILYWDNTNSRLGIGTTSPVARLDIRGTSAVNAYDVPDGSEDLRVLSSNNRAYDGGIITIGGSSGTTGFIKTAATNISAGNVVIGNRRLPTDTSMTAGIILNTSGYVGINDMTPSERLEVTGNIKSSGTVSGTTMLASTAVITPVIYGGQSANGALILESTLDATKGNVFINPNGGNVGIGDSNSSVSIPGNLTIGGNLEVQGTRTFLNTTELNVKDKLINIAYGSTTDTAANGGGILIHGATNKSILYGSTNGDFISTENFNLVSGKRYRINNVDIANIAETLTNKTIGSGSTWNGNIIGIAYGGTGLTSALPNGAVIFSNGTTMAADQSNLYFDDGSNRLGIGTSSPSTKLDVVGGGIRTDSSVVSPLVMNANTSGTTDLTLQSASGDVILTPASGYGVGIGTTSPASILDIYASASPYGAVRLHSTTTESSMGFYSSSSGDSWVAGLGGWSNIGDFTIGQIAGGTIGAKLLIEDSTGNVGIGTTTPGTYKLYVAGTGKFTGSVDTDTQFLGQASDTVSAPSFSWTGDTNVGMYRPGTDILGFTTAGTERMRIDASGNVGINDTSMTDKLEVGGNIRANAIYGTAITASTQFVSTVATGTAPMQVASTTKVNNLNADYVDGYSSENLAKRVDLSSQVQLVSYRRSVIALVDLTNTDPSANSYSKGTLYFHRVNAVSPANEQVAIVNLAKLYNSASFRGQILKLGNTNDNIRLCTFSYGGVKYGGVEFYLDASNTQYVYFNGESNFNIFGLDYYDTQNSVALNSEVNGSLNYSDYTAITGMALNGNTIWNAGNDGTGSGLDADMLDGLHSTSFMQAASGTTNYITKFTSANSIGNSLIYDNGTNIGIGTTSPSTKFDVNGNIRTDGYDYQIQTQSTWGGWDRAFSFINPNGSQLTRFGAVGSTYGSVNYSYIGSDYTNPIISFKSIGSVGIGTISPSTKLDVVGGGIRTDSSVVSPLVMNANTSGTTDLTLQSAAGNVILTPASGYGVGIGTTNPSAALEIKVASSTLINNIKFGDSTPGYLTSGSGGIFLSNSSGNSVFMVTHSGNVGIGTTTPGTYKLYVAGTGKFTGSVDTDAQFLGQASDTVSAPSFSWTGDTNVGMYRPGTDILGFTTAGVERMRIDASGNMTLDGGNLLYSGGGYTGSAMAFQSGDSSGASVSLDAGGRTIVGSGESAATVVSNSGVAASTETLLLSSDSDIQFITNLQNGWSYGNRLSILSSGNVGIGNTSPSEKLTVAGNISANAISGTAITASTQFVSTVATGTAPMQVASTTKVTNLNADLLDGYDSSSFMTAVSGTANYVTKFASSNTLGNSVIYDNGTSIGIGTSSPNYKLQVTDDSYTSGEHIIFGLVPVDGATALVAGYNANGTASTSSFIRAGGSTPLYLGTTTYPQLIALLNTGNLGIGTSSPSTKLDVVGGGIRTDSSVVSPLVMNANTSGTINLTLQSASGNVILTPATSYGVGIGTTTPGTYKLYVAGTGKFTGSVDTDTQFLGQASDTVSAPSFSWTGDTNVGMYRPATDVIGFTTAGVERMRIDASGNIGINDTSMTDKLEVGGNIRANAIYGTAITASTQFVSTVATGTAPMQVASTTVVTNLNSDLLDSQQGSYYNHRLYNVQNYLGSGYNSGGTEKPNWFGSGKLQLQMLAGSNVGAPDTWNDVLWMSSYTGGDVKLSNALVFSKYGPNTGFVQSNYDSTAWGTYYKLWNSGNDGTGSGLDADMLDGLHSTSFMQAASGTTNYVTKFTSANAIGNSVIYDDGTNVGIGTNSPSTKLDILGTNERITIRNSGNSGKVLIGTSSAGGGFVQLYDDSGNTNAMIRSYDVSYLLGGNLGIGTSSPSTKLDVVGGGIRTDSSVVSPLVMNANTSGTTDLTLQSASGDVILTPASGYGVGIGTSSPVYNLQIGTTGGGTFAIANGGGGPLIISGNSSDGVARINNSNSGVGAIQFQSRGSDTVRIDNSGNVGIGTTTPGTYKLYVAGTGKFTGSVDTDAQFLGQASDTVSAPSFSWTGDTNVGMYRPGTDILGFTTAGVERMRIDASGNVGIGKTPSYKLDVNGTAKALSFGQEGTGTTLISFPGGASYSYGSSTITGAIKITLPVYKTNTMMRMTVKIYNYSSNKSYTIDLGGYNHATGWANTFANITSGNGANLPVRFGYGGSNNAIWIGETTSTWSYPKVYVTDFEAGYSNYSLNTWDDGWSVSIVDAFDTIETTANSAYAWNNLNDGSGSGLDADTVDGVHASSFLSSASGTTNYITKFTSANAIGNSLIYDNGTSVGIGTSSPNTSSKLTLDGNNTNWGLDIYNSGSGGINWYIGTSNSGWSTGAGKLLISRSTTSTSSDFTIDSSGNVGIGTTSPGTKLSVNGTGYFGSTLSSASTIVSTIANGANGFYVSGYSSSTGYGNYIGNWASANRWGIGPATGSADSTVKIGMIDGSGNWLSNASNLSITGQFASTVATGTAPMQVASTTAVTNLNSDLLDGYHASSFMQSVYSAGYYGLVTPNGSQSDWIRTTSSGIIPYTSGGTSSLGTLGWPFSTVYANTYYEGGVTLSSKYQASLGYTPVNKAGDTMTGDLTATRYKGTNSLVLNTYTTVNPSSNVFLYSQPNDRDSWIYLDSADTTSNWGIYHRQIDSAVGTIESNSIAFIGGGDSSAKAYIGLGTGNGYFAGSVTASAFYYSSDRTLKTNIKPIEDSLTKLLQLNGYTFNWKSGNDKKTHIGLIAQEVEKVFPEAVKTDEQTGLKSIEYANMVAPIIEGVKDQQSQIDNLKKQNEEQQKEIDDLKKQIESLLKNKK